MACGWLAVSGAVCLVLGAIFIAKAPTVEGRYHCGSSAIQIARDGMPATLSDGEPGAEPFEGDQAVLTACRDSAVSSALVGVALLGVGTGLIFGAATIGVVSGRRVMTAGGSPRSFTPGESRRS